MEVLMRYLHRFFLNGYEYDVNSEYPFAMQKNMPVGNPSLIKNPLLDDIFNKDYIWFVKGMNLRFILN